LRQILACPAVLGIKSHGAAIDYVTETGGALIDSGYSFVVYTPFSKVVPFIVDSLTKKIKDLRVYVVSGGMTALEFAKQWQGFQNNKSHNKVLICVIKSGASFQATTASHAFFIGYEWDFNQNVQSEDRLCRLGQKNFVNIYYLVHKGTIDEAIVQRLNDKQDANDWAIGSSEVYELLLKRFKVKLGRH
jgi:SNF2 family DNA or RNA helicase